MEAAPAPANTEVMDIWLDCDPGHDDMMAIILAAFHPRINLLGISTTCGNVSLDLTTENALKTIYMCGIKGVEVVRGSKEALFRGKIESCPVFGDSGLDGANLPPPTQKLVDKNPFLYMAERLLAHPKKVIVVGTGPYTNLAILLKAFPEVKEKISQFVLMGGAVDYGNVGPAAEFNVFCDPEAAQVVLDSKIPTFFMPLEVTHKLLYHSGIKAKICATPSNFTTTLCKLLDYFEVQCRAYDETEGAPVHDPATIAWLLHPEIFKVRDAHIKIETKSQYCDGRTVVDFCHISKLPFNAKIAVDVKADLFWDIMVKACHEADKVSPLNKPTA